MARITHVALVANSVATVVLDGYTAMITVTNRDSSGEVYFTTNGSTPAVRGDDCYLCLGARTVASPTIVGLVTVRLIAATAVNVSVEGETG